MSLPEEFERQMLSVMGEGEYARFCEAVGSEAPTSIRVNPAKPADGSVPEGVPVPWCPSGRYLPERPSFTLDPLFHAGTYYVQEASSMFLDYVLRKFVDRPAVVLDLCAAPGGKSTLALSALPEGSVLVANEIVRQRSQILAENLIKWGNPNVIVTNNCAADFQNLGTAFDVVICDAPCSGEGMFRKDAKAIDEWSPQNVGMCRQRQRDILADVWPCLKPGGLLIYSTCTYNVHENEGNVVWAVNNLGAEVVDPCVPASWGVTGNMLEGQTFPAFHFFPHKTKGEGFFACAMRKGADDNTAGRYGGSGKGRKRIAPRKELPFPKELKMWIADAQQYSFVSDETGCHAFPVRYKELLESSKSVLRIVHCGIRLATIKGKAVIPAHSLAMSVALNRNVFPEVEVDVALALQYLRAETVALPSSAPTGYVLLTYKGVPLGFAKNLGNRANNLYPSEWRIRFAGK